MKVNEMKERLKDFYQKRGNGEYTPDEWHTKNYVLVRDQGIANDLYKF